MARFASCFVVVLVLTFGSAAAAQADPCFPGDLTDSELLVGESYSFSYTGGAGISNFKVSIDWGDKTVEGGGVRDYSHTYTRGGSFDAHYSESGLNDHDGDPNTAPVPCSQELDFTVTVRPEISIADASVVEGSPFGRTPMIFHVTLSGPSEETVSVQYNDSAGTASSPSDYDLVGFNLSIPPGETSATITVNVVADGFIEPDETFTVALSSPSNAVIERNPATGTIVNDDQPPPTGGGGGGGGGGTQTGRCDGRAATIVGTPGKDRLRGTPQPDVIVALGGDDTVVGLGGDDRICLGGGNDEAEGNNGADRIFGAGGRDTVRAGDGKDLVEGGLGNDAIHGNAAGDTLRGNAGDDTLNGGPDRDVCRGGPGRDVIRRCEA